MSWQVLTCISVLFFSGAMVLQRRLMHHHKCEPYAFVVVSQGLVGVLTLIFACSRGFSLPDFSGLWLPMLGSISFHGFGYITHAKALQIVEASVFSVFYATQAIWVMLLGIIIFHEHVQPAHLLGVACIFGSIGFLTYRLGKLKLDAGTVLGLATGLLFGIAVTCWAYVGRHVDPVSWAAIGFCGVAMTAFLMRPKAVYELRPFLTRAVLPKMLMLALLFSIGGVTLLVAYTLGDLSAVSPLRQMSIVVTVLIAMICIPQERTSLWYKVMATVMCVCGALLIVI